MQLLFDRIQVIVDRPLVELTTEDQMALCKIRDELLQSKASIANDILVGEQKIENEYAKRFLEMRLEKVENKDAKGNVTEKKKHTEEEVKSFLEIEFQKEREKINALRFVRAQAEAKADAVMTYITCLRDHLRGPVFISQDGN